MKNMLVMLVLGGCFGSVLGSEKNDERIVFKANVGTLTYNPLRYCDKKYIGILNNIYGIQCQQNEPFLMIYYPWTRGVTERYISKEEQDLRDIVESITLVPYRYFMNDSTEPRDSNEFKKCGNILLSCSKQFTNMKNGFQIQLGSYFGEMNPQALLNQFKKTPQCEPGCILNEKVRLLVFVDTTKLEEELCEAGIIRKVGPDYGYGHGKQRYEQGINGYFGDEIKLEQKAKATALFYSRCKKLFGCSLAAIILMYVLYQKLYTTAG